jgi:hypothetical protein
VRTKGKERDKASQALIDLRIAMGMSQGEFADNVMGLSEISIARYETSHPPRGEQLIRFAEIADQQGRLAKDNHRRQYSFAMIADRFRVLYVAGLVDSAPAQLTMVRASTEEPEHGYLLTKVEGEQGLRSAQNYLSILAALRSSSKAARAIAEKLVDQMEEAVDALDGNPLVSDTRKALRGQKGKR